MIREDLVHHYFSTVVGPLELRVSDQGVRSISFIPRPTSPVTSEGNTIAKKLIKELDSYFAKTLKQFTVPLDPETGTEFQRRVWHELTRIPYGETRSYGEVAKAMGKPRAARAVGLANKKNCIPILIPCHRVIRAHGAIGGYNSGVHIKKKLLDLEGITI
jgi:methylated-DNA-[protein]-cysteine S-methyltransferase